MPEITIHYHNKIQRVSVQSNISLIELLAQHGYGISSPCNGMGTCGKCRVQIHQPNLPHTDEEKKHLSPEDMQKGWHLACRVRVQGDMEFTVGLENENASILTMTSISPVSGSSVMQKKACQLPAPALFDQRPDYERIISSCGENPSEAFPVLCNPFPVLDLETLRQLPKAMREKDYELTALHLLGQLTGVEGGNTMDTLYGIAVDIGTTTLAAYLYDLNTGALMSVASMLNPQKKHGADVISRIDYASQSDIHAAEMAELIRTALNELTGRLAHSRGLKKTDVYLVALAGNTTMLHLLLQLPALALARSPFVPVTVSLLLLKPPDLNLAINRLGHIILLPGVSAYVGADTVAAVLSTGMYSRKEVALLVDIGTNGEIVLGNSDFMVACSTAAGPAFEGASISCGTGGVEGAVSEVSVGDNGKLLLKTIGEKEPVGICGSGLIDAIACMLRIGILEETGRILEKEELDDRTIRYADHLFKVNGQQAFSLGRSGIYITQKDIREVQNAKAAIAAGIAVLVREAELNLEDIHSVYLAGGFGSFMRIRSALATGLLPKIAEEKITAVGNAAGAGAILALLSEKELLLAADVAKRIKYLELSSRQDFVSEYTDHMFFEAD